MKGNCFRWLTAFAAVFLLFGMAGAGDAAAQEGSNEVQAATTATAVEDTTVCPITLQTKRIHKYMLQATSDSSYKVVCEDGNRGAPVDTTVKAGDIIAWHQTLSSSERVKIKFRSDLQLLGGGRREGFVHLPFNQWAYYIVQEFADRATHEYGVEVGGKMWINDTGPKIVVKDP